MKFYYGAASGQTRKALQKAEEPRVMLNYASSGRTPWPGIEDLAIDSGGYSVIKGRGGYETSAEDYMEWVEEQDPSWFALRDFPCKPDVLMRFQRTVGEHQEMTLDASIRVVEEAESRGLNNWVPVVQGFEVQDYLQNLDELNEHGLINGRLAIGTLCRRNQDREIRRIINTVNKASPGTELHAFGINRTVLRFPDVVRTLSSADSQAYDFAARMEAMHTSRKRTWEMDHRHYQEFKRDVERYKEAAEQQAKLREATR